MPTYENPSEYFVGEAPVSVYTEDILKTADDTAAVVVISRDSSEAADYSTDMKCSSPDDSFERPLALSQNEKDMLSLAKSHSKKVIVHINSDSPMEIDELKNDAGINSILWTRRAWHQWISWNRRCNSRKCKPFRSFALDTYAKMPHLLRLW